MTQKPLGVWFPAIKAGTGTDTFTMRLVEALNRQDIRAEITWLPHRAEYAPYTVKPPVPPEWVNLVHINSWTHKRFIPPHLPLVVTIHSCVHDPAFGPYKSKLQKWYHEHWIKKLEAHAIKQADTVTAVSQYTAQQATKVFNHQNINTLYNGIDIESFQPDNHEIPNTPFRLLFVGNLNRRKGADLLPAIMERLGTAFELLYTGTQNELDISVFKLKNLVSLGRISDQSSLVKIYQSCDALLFPTRLEGLSLSALEAQACGLPIISSWASSMPEVVKNNLTGILCPVDNIDAFVEGAKKMHNDHSYWLNMKQAARDHAQLFSEDATVKRYIECYQNISS